MALETLKGVSQIDGFKIVRDKPDGMTWDEFDKMRDEFPINIVDRMNTISFKLQNGPVKEKGVNGCQVDTLIEAARIILEKLNDRHSCPENNMAIAALNDALGFLKARKLNREMRGVEGTNQV